MVQANDDNAREKAFCLFILKTLSMCTAMMCDRLSRESYAALLTSKEDFAQVMCGLLPKALSMHFNSMYHDYFGKRLPEVTGDLDAFGPKAPHCVLGSGCGLAVSIVLMAESDFEALHPCISPSMSMEDRVRVIVAVYEKYTNKIVQFAVKFFKEPCEPGCKEEQARLYDPNRDLIHLRISGME